MTVATSLIKAAFVYCFSISGVVLLCVKVFVTNSFTWIIFDGRKITFLVKTIRKTKIRLSN